MQKNNRWIGWAAIVVLFLLPYTWPIALFLLIHKLTQPDKKQPKTYRHPYDIQRQQSAAQSCAQSGASPEQPPEQNSAKKAHVTAKQAPNPPSKIKSFHGKAFTIAGGIVSGLFGLGLLSELFEVISRGQLLYEVADLSALLGLFSLGLVLLLCGLSRTRKEKRFRKYLSLIGTHDVLPLDLLMRISGTSRRTLIGDLQDMLDRGLLGVGYLDMEKNCLVLGTDGIPVEPSAPEPSHPENAPHSQTILLEIRRINECISDPFMSKKIDRIEEITGKILEYQSCYPEKAGQLRNFLGYYLPTTLKILNAYVQLDSQGVDGENISAAKTRVEGMMDKVVEGFEIQLDRLFRENAMDLTSDISVLEQMLEKDGLSGRDRITMQ